MINDTRSYFGVIQIEQNCPYTVVDIVKLAYINLASDKDVRILNKRSRGDPSP